MRDWEWWRTHGRQGWLQVQRVVRPMIRPRSLSRQMAISAVAIALSAILATALISSIVVSSVFADYLKTELRQSASDEAQRVSSIYHDPQFPTQGNFKNAVEFALVYKFSQDATGDANSQIWIADAQGNVLFPPTINTVWHTGDPTVIIPAMRQTLQSGVVSASDLPDPNQAWLHYSARGYAVAPIHADTTSGSPIIGVVAVSSQRGLSGGPGFIQSVNRTLLGGGLAIALLVALVGALLARRITQPLDRLSNAADKMAAGDLGARVDLPEHELPAEIEQLAQTFNAMAATLQRDVNELRRQERLQRELVANVAHELATPLTAIRGFSEALADNVARGSAEREEIGRIIHRETVRLQGLVNQLRMVARLESGAEVMDLHPLPLAALIQDTIDVLSTEIVRQHVTVQQELPDDLPDALADTDRMTQVMLNLLDNALRHTPAEGTITIQARTDGPLIWVTIADSGPGIAAEDLPRIFDRFYRADASRNSHTGGTGLGLAIVKGIVGAHGGEVRAENGPEGGARISFSVRMATPPIVEPAKQPEPGENTRKRRQGVSA